jgi:hypothetical protein
MKEDPEGQYVSYLEHQEALDALRYENDKLWERIAQQVKEFDDLNKDRKEWIARHGALRTLSEDLIVKLSDAKTTLLCHAVGYLLAALIGLGLIYSGVLSWC